MGFMFVGAALCATYNSSCTPSTQHNSLDDFEYEITTIAKYNAILHGQSGELVPNNIKEEYANQEGIIITG
jgi:hypothetical protein